MTGFARAEGEHAGMRWLWEIKSVNGRGLDVKLRMPSGFDALDPPARTAVSARFKRGSVQATLSITRDPAQGQAVRVDVQLVERLLEAGEPFIRDNRVKKPTWDGLLAVRGVVVSEEAAELPEVEREALNMVLLAGFEAALADLEGARRAEGRMLASVLGDGASRLESLTAAARATAAAAPAAALDRIRLRLESLAPEVKLDPARLAQEAAVAATRADVQEELERLAAHTAELRALLTKPEPAGRRLDFLGQELTREANTLCSKSSDMELTRIGLDIKTVVDQIKEQAANVE